MSSLTWPYQLSDASFPDAHIVTACREQALPAFRRDISFEFIEQCDAVESRGHSASPPPPAARLHPVVCLPQLATHSDAGAFHNFAASRSQSQFFSVSPTPPIALMQLASNRPRNISAAAVSRPKSPQTMCSVSIEQGVYPKGIRLLVINGIPGSVSDESIKTAVESFLLSFSYQKVEDLTQTGVAKFLSRDENGGKVTIELHGTYAKCALIETFSQSLSSNLGEVRFCSIIIYAELLRRVPIGFLIYVQVFAWRPAVFKWLFDEKQLLSGILLENIPARCASEDFESFRQSMLSFSGIQKLKVQANSKVTCRSQYVS